MATPAPQAENFYVVGGTMRHDSPSYVERRADRELFRALRRAEYCHVLTARQMGKSSLMLRTAFRLRQAGVKVAVLDLTAIGQNLSAEQWYSGLVLQLGERLGLEDKLLDFWTAHTWLGPMQRWVETLRKAVLPESAGQLIIFVDEIDAVRSLKFSTDEFFAGIRECYNHRRADEEMRRLTFCLIGVAMPSDLIRDTRTTPFNVGTRIELNDFTQAEALPLADGLPWGEAQNHAILKRVLYWTSGHPYLTQRICQAAADGDRVRRTADPDALIEELFFSKRADEYDNNLMFVRERLLRSGADLTALLNLYAKVRRGKAVPDADADPLVSILRLSGVTRGEKGLLRVRNRIYEGVFDNDWVADNLPGAEARSQREAYRRGVWRTAIVSAVILAVVIGLAITALWQLKVAREEARLRRQLLYTTQMKLVNQEWENANISRVEQLLKETKPLPGDDDLRGYEWPLFYHNSHKEVFRLPDLDPVVSARFLKDRSTLAIGTGSYSMVDNERTYTIRLYDWEAGKAGVTFRANTKASFNVVVFSPDLKYVATDSPDNRIAWWEVNSGQRRPDLGDVQDASLRAAAFVPNQPYLVSGDGKGVVRIWNLVTRQAEWTKEVGRIITGLTMSPDGSLLAITTASNKVELLDMKTRRMLPPFSVKEAALNHAFFSPDGKTLAVTAEVGGLYLWDVSRRQIPPRQLPYPTEITALA
ncbi:MAG TPA: AAA-like domain-containing protein, partial [Blastocatellia bacterium]|nr:AAA-like domain-containing protein [Blastocatellia bacterium]